MRIAPGFRSCPRRCFGQEATSFMKAAKSAYAGELGFEAPSPPSWMTSAILYGNGWPLLRSLRRASTTAKNWPAKLPRASRKPAAKEWFFNANLPSSLQPGNYKTSHCTTDPCSKTVGVPRSEMPRQSGSHAASDDLKEVTRNAECPDNAGRITGLLSDVIKRRSESQRQKPTRLNMVSERLDVGGRHGCCRLLRATSKRTSVCFHQHALRPQAPNGPFQTPAIESLTACSSRGNDDVAMRAYSVRAVPRLQLLRLQAGERPHKSHETTRWGPCFWPRLPE